GREVIPEILDELKFLRRAQVKDRRQIRVHPNRSRTRVKFLRTNLPFACISTKIVYSAGHDLARSVRGRDGSSPHDAADSGPWAEGAGPETQAARGDGVSRSKITPVRRRGRRGGRSGGDSSPRIFAHQINHFFA